MNKNPSRHVFHFPNWSYACKAIEAWWALQDTKGETRSFFHISADGTNTDVYLLDKSLAGQDGFIDFLVSRVFIETIAVHGPN